MPFRRTALGNAQRFADSYKALARYNHSDGAWYLLKFPEETHWERDETQHVKRLAREVPERVNDFETLTMAN